MPRPKFIQAKKSFLKSPMSDTENGSFVLNQLFDCYGNQIQSTHFVTNLRFTFNPGGSDEEIISATGFTVNSDGSTTVDTGIVRKLQAVYPYTTGGTAYNHPAGTPVIIMPDNPQLFEDILAYVDSLVLAAAVPATKTANGYVKTTETLSAPRARSALVSQKSSQPSMKVTVNPFAAAFMNKDIAVVTATDTSSIVAPVSNPRVDLVVYDTVNSVIALRTGTENASATTSNYMTYKPTPTTGDIVLAAVFNRVGEVKILEEDDATNGFIIRFYEPSMYDGNTYLTSLNITTADTDQTQTTQDATRAVGEANATTKNNKLAQSFIPAVKRIRGVKLYKSADTGSFTGTVTISIQADSAGSPSGSDLATVTIPNATWLLIATGEFEVAFTTEYATMTVGSLYWIVVTTSTSDNSNHPNLGSSAAGGYASGTVKFNNTTDGWTLVASIDLYFKTIIGILGQAAGGSATNGLIPAAMLPYNLVDFNMTAGSNVASSTTETTVYSKLLPAGFFTANSGLRLRMMHAWAVQASSGADQQTIKVYLNGTNIISQTGVQSTSGSALAGQHWNELFLLNNNSLSSQKMLLKSEIDNGFKSTYDAQSVNNVGRISGSAHTSTTTSAVDTSAPIVLKVTITNSVSASGTNFTHKYAIVEKIG